MRTFPITLLDDDYALRPREQHGRRRTNGGRARVCVDAHVRRRGRHLSNSPAIKRIERGLNRDGSAWNLAGAVAAARAGLAREEVTTLRRMLYLLAAGDSPLLADAEMVFGLGRLAE